MLRVGPCVRKQGETLKDECYLIFVNLICIRVGPCVRKQWSLDYPL